METNCLFAPFQCYTGENSYRNKKYEALIQRVSRASVTVDEKVVGDIGKGFLIFLGIGLEDTENTVKTLVDKIVQLRIFSDEQGKINLSLLDVQGEILVVSQFTLHADIRRGRRPSFTKAAPPINGNSSL